MRSIGDYRHSSKMFAQAAASAVDGTRRHDYEHFYSKLPERNDIAPCIKHFIKQGYYFYSKDAPPMNPNASVNRRQNPRQHMNLFTGKGAGGMLFFNQTDQRHDILSHIAADLQAGHWVLPFSEVVYENEFRQNPRDTRTELQRLALKERGDFGHRLVADFDCDARVLTEDEILAIGEAFDAVLTDYYPSHAAQPIPIAVSTCGPRLKRGTLSLSLHMIAHVRVTGAEARQLLFALRMRLIEIIPMNGITLDAGIYRELSASCSLRLIYATKTSEDCPRCHGAPYMCHSCSLCSDGKVLSRFVYEPKCIIVSGKLDAPRYRQLHADWFTVLTTHSIFASNPDEQRLDFAIPPNAQIYVPAVTRLKEADREPVTKKPTNVVQLADLVTGLLQEFINRIEVDGKRPYLDLIIKRTQMTEDKSAMFITFAPTNAARMCPYAGRQHKSNMIYMCFKSWRGGVLEIHCYDSDCKPEKRIAYTNIPVSIVRGVFGEDAALYKTLGPMQQTSFKGPPPLSIHSGAMQPQIRKKPKLDKPAGKK